MTFLTTLFNIKFVLKMCCPLNITGRRYKQIFIYETKLTGDITIFKLELEIKRMILLIFTCFKHLSLKQI